MVQLAIIADDLTGALDTGVKFVKSGNNIQIFCSGSLDKEQIEESTNVIVIDTETRHVSPNEAYNVVFKIIKNCEEAGIKYFYKKTDSALRGNIGSELAALHDALNKQVEFIPALPREGRITKQGIQYINGIEVGKSIFAKDPINPVKHSYIADIIHEQTDLDVSCSFEKADDGDIVVFDAETEEDLNKITNIINQQNKLGAIAGCSGYAEYLPQLINLKSTQRQNIPKTDKLFVISGSINKITLDQLDFAEQNGIKRLTLNSEQKLLTNYFDTTSGQLFFSNLSNQCRINKQLIIDVGEKDNSILEIANDLHLSINEIPTRIAFRISEIFKNIVNLNLDVTILITGGDTLFAAIKSISPDTIKLIGEVIPGAVLIHVIIEGKTIQIVSKSGGFGNKDMIIELGNVILK